MEQLEHRYWLCSQSSDVRANDWNVRPVPEPPIGAVLRFERALDVPDEYGSSR